MKKIFSIILCYSILLALNINAFAVEKNNTLLTYTNQASYEIFIPASATIDGETRIGEITIKISDSRLEEGTYIKVSVDSRNDWLLVDEDKNNSISYKLYADDEVVSDGESVISAEIDVEKTLILEADEIKVGNFVDYLTFTSEIVRSIPFEFEGYRYIAQYGMTWEDWINSDLNTTLEDVGYEIVVNDQGGISKKVNGEIVANLYKERLCLTLVKSTDVLIEDYEYFWE